MSSTGEVCKNCRFLSEDEGDQICTVASGPVYVIEPADVEWFGCNQWESTEPPDPTVPAVSPAQFMATHGGWRRFETEADLARARAGQTFRIVDHGDSSYTHYALKANPDGSWSGYFFAIVE